MPRLQRSGCAVGAAVGAAARGQQRHPGEAALQVEGRERVAVELIGVERRGRAPSGVGFHQVQQTRLARAGEHRIGPRPPAGVIRAEGRVGAAQHHRDVRKGVLHHRDRFHDPRVPVGHGRGDQDEVRARHAFEIVAQPVRIDPVA